MIKIQRIVVMLDNSFDKLEKYAIGLSEVDELFNYLDEEYLNKIPNNFRTFIKEHKNTTYIPSFNPDIPINEQKLHKETNIIISIIYLNYFCNKEEKERLLNADKAELEIIEKEIREKYNPDNIFKKNKEDSNENIEETNKINIDLVNIENLVWYKKIFIRIRNFIIDLLKP